MSTDIMFRHWRSSVCIHLGLLRGAAANSRIASDSIYVFRAQLTPHTRHHRPPAWTIDNMSDVVAHRPFEKCSQLYAISANFVILCHSESPHRETPFRAIPGNYGLVSVHKILFSANLSVWWRYVLDEICKERFQDVGGSGVSLPKKWVCGSGRERERSLSSNMKAWLLSRWFLEPWTIHSISYYRADSWSREQYIP